MKSCKRNMIKIYGIKNCDKCRKAVYFLSDSAMFYDIKDKPLSDGDISLFLVKLGETLVNKKSLTWRTLSDEDKNMNLNDLIRKFPLLIKRPLIKFNESITVGWDEEIKKIFN